ncbi:MAG TPA: hypothetical protein VEK38_00870 [Candidatus Bathyarchaeia archaeon]|nr:hypothetical protein [Candidatus Bathyarchaeia archaeon]
MQKIMLIIGVMSLACNVQAYKIGLCIVATGKYIQFVRPLVESADNYFCPGHEKTYFVLTDGEVHEHSHIVRIEQKRLGWPNDALMRPVLWYGHHGALRHMDYLFNIDADMLFIDYVGDEVLGDLVGVRHPGFVLSRKEDYEKNPFSAAYVPEDIGQYYFAAGFFGGAHDAFIALLEGVSKTILADKAHNYTAIWHDESHVNRYFAFHPPTVVLPCSYCYPENAEGKFWFPQIAGKLLALDKDHAVFQTPL